MNYKFTIIGVIVIVGVMFGLVYLGTKSNQGGQITLPSDIDTSQGIKFLEYGDFQCPACAAYNPILMTLKEEYAGKIEFAYKHFPLKQHKNAEPSAYAAEAARNQGKFWEMDILLFSGQNEWANSEKPLEIFKKYAQSLDLNIDTFVADYNSSEIKKKVSSEYAEGVGLGVNSTPTFFINGKKINNPGSYEEFKSIFEQLIQK